MQRGRKPNLPEIRAITGKPSQTKFPVGNVRARPLRAIPKPPAWMKNKWALEEWDEIAPELVENRLLTKASLRAFVFMISLCGEIIAEFEKKGKFNVAYLVQYRLLLNEFGLTPCSQMRAHVAPETENENPFLHNRKAA